MSRAPLATAETKAECLARFMDQGSGHINCAQTVLRFALLVAGDDPDRMTVARQFGGGMAGTGETCGAITGATLALGLLDELKGEVADPGESRSVLQDLIARFSSEFGATRCRELTGFDFTVSGEHDAFVASGGMDLCQRCVGWTCDQLALVLTPQT